MADQYVRHILRGFHTMFGKKNQNRILKKMFLAITNTNSNITGERTI